MPNNFAARARACPIGCERGAGVILVITLAGVLLLVGAAVMLMSRFLAVQHRVASAADQAALAAADIRRQLIEGNACEQAREITAAHRAKLVSCQLGGDFAVVVAADSFLGVSVQSSAKAGAPR